MQIGFNMKMGGGGGGVCKGGGTWRDTLVYP